jgi:hypothetical protein
VDHKQGHGIVDEPDLILHKDQQINRVWAFIKPTKINQFEARRILIDGWRSLRGLLEVILQKQTKRCI